jgi:hypothetical protein
MSLHSGLWKTDNEWMELVEKSKSLSTASVKSYKKQLRSATRAFGVEGPTSLSTIMSRPDLIERARRSTADNSLRSYLAAVVSLFKRGEEAGFFKRSDPEIAKLQGAWSEHLHGSSKRYLDRIDNNRESDREREGRATLTEWHSALEAALKADPDAPSTLLIAFHALVFPPLRGGDLARVRLGYQDEGNCIFRDPDDDAQTLLLIRDHKTSRSFGALKRTLRGQMVKILRSNVNKSPREWLFVTQEGAPYSESGFSSWKSGVLNEAFGKPVTTNSLRHEYISGMDRQNQTLKEARELASSMGHGLNTQRQYVRFQDRG